MDWWHEYVMRADALFYLRNKVRFGNPFLDSASVSSCNAPCLVWLAEE
jgi:hypothetical protein